jgi:ATP-binding cassette, subfamily B, bacterial PglK
MGRGSSQRRGESDEDLVIEFVSALRQAVRLVSDERRWRWLIVVAMAIGVSLLEVGGALLILVLMGLVASVDGAITVPILGDLSQLFPDIGRSALLISVALSVGAFFVVRSIAVMVQAYVQNRMVQNAASRLSTHLVRGYMSMPYLFHTQHNSAELVRNSFATVNQLTSSVMTPGLQVVAEFFIVLALAAVLAVTAPMGVVVAILVLGPTIYVLLRIVQPRLRALGRRGQEANRKSLQAVQQALGGVREIRIFGREGYFTSTYRAARQEAARVQYVYNTVVDLPRAVIETALVLTIVAIFTAAVLANDGLEDLLSTLGIFAYVGLRLQPSLRTIVTGMNRARFGAAVIEDLVEDRARVDAALAAAQRPEFDVHGGRSTLERSIEFRNVSFSYSPQDAPALAGIDLTIRRGEFVGICGPTGGGKSTLVDLLVGLLEPTAGEVLIDGVRVTDDPAWWYAQLGLVSQNIFLIDDSVRRNIAFGLRDEEIDDDRLQRCIDRAQLATVIDGLAQGLDTEVGERGIRLSGGQRQRVAIARALYRESQVLIFDEGTSALDSATEAALIAAVDELKQGRTLISVAHRLTTVQRADRIVVIDEGRIAAVGPYDDLIGRSDLFRRLAT